jgi:hypothetical protein
MGIRIRDPIRRHLPLTSAVRMRRPCSTVVSGCQQIVAFDSDHWLPTALMYVDGVITVKSRTSENRSHCNQEDCCPVHSLQYLLTSGGTQDTWPMTHEGPVRMWGMGSRGQYPVNLVPGHASVIQCDCTTAPRSQIAYIKLYCSRVGAGVGPLDPCSAQLPQNTL